MLRFEIEQFLEMLESDKEMYMAVRDYRQSDLLESYIDDLREILNETKQPC